MCKKKTGGGGGGVREEKKNHMKRAQGDIAQQYRLHNITSNGNYFSGSQFTVNLQAQLYILLFPQLRSAFLIKCTLSFTLI